MAYNHDDIWKALVDLEKRINDVFKVLECDQIRLDRLDRRDISHHEMLDCLKDMIDANTDQIEKLQIDMMKMRDAYYSVFPDRLAQDVQVMRQIDSITSSSAERTQKKKS